MNTSSLQESTSCGFRHYRLVAINSHLIDHELLKHSISLLKLGAVIASWMNTGLVWSGCDVWRNRSQTHCSHTCTPTGRQSTDGQVARKHYWASPRLLWLRQWRQNDAEYRIVPDCDLTAIRNERTSTVQSNICRQARLILLRTDVVMWRRMT